MEIRELIPNDLEELLRLYPDLHSDEEPATAANAESTWREIRDNPSIKYFGVFMDNELVGTCNITIVPNLTRNCRPFGLIENVVTGKAKRRQGIGKALLQHALDYAWSANCYKVMLMTGRLDEETFAFYESAGFDRHAKQAFVARP